MKKIFKVFLPVILCFLCFAIPVSADEYENYDFTYPYAIDDAGIIANNESVSTKLDKIGSKYDVDIVVVTVESTGNKTAEAFADDFYDYNGYSKDGILFLLSMENRDLAISTKGYGIEVFTDYGLDYIIECMRDDLANDDFDYAFMTFADKCELFLEQAENGKPYDYGNTIKTTKDYLTVIGISAVIGLVIAIIVVLILKSQLTSVKFQRNADSYLKSGSINLTQNNNIFLYKTLSKTKRESQSSSGGGSSTHRSSSGSSHGGRSGKF